MNAWQKATHFFRLLAKPLAGSLVAGSALAQPANAIRPIPDSPVEAAALTTTPDLQSRGFDPEHTFVQSSKAYDFGNDAVYEYAVIPDEDEERMNARWNRMEPLLKKQYCEGFSYLQLKGGGIKYLFTTADGKELKSYSFHKADCPS